MLRAPPLVQVLTLRIHDVLEKMDVLDAGLSTVMTATYDSGWRAGAFEKVHLQFMLTASSRLLAKRSAVHEGIRFQGDAETAQFQVNRILVPCIRFAQEKTQVSVRLDPDIQPEVAIAYRHSPGYVPTGRRLYHVAATHFLIAVGRCLKFSTGNHIGTVPILEMPNEQIFRVGKCQQAFAFGCGE